MRLSTIGKSLCLAAGFIASQAFAFDGNTPTFDGSSPDGYLRMGRRANVSQTRSGFGNRGAWKPDEIYKGDYTIFQGDTVSHGTFNGNTLWWWAKFYAAGSHLEPGQFAPEGGTSPWVLVNSQSAVASGTVNYTPVNWNNTIKGNLRAGEAIIPTWRHGAVGAYTMNHDDIGAINFDLGIRPVWELRREFPDINHSWGVFVKMMSQQDWEYAREMAAVDGIEMFCHSYDHTSAADQWQWFYPGTNVPTHDPAIPEEIRGLTVVGTWGNPNQDQVWPFDYEPITLESEMVSIRATPYWTQNAPSSEPAGAKVLDDNGRVITTVIEPVVTPKAGVQTITLPSGQKQYVKYTYRDTTGAGQNKGYIAATGPTWFEASQLDQYGENGWSSTSPNVAGDQGAPGFVAKVWCVKAWSPELYKVNIRDAADSMDKYIYEPIKRSPHFRKGMRTAYYGYPFDAYSEVTHDSLERYGYTGARGGAKSGVPTPGDFFHPYRIDFDAFFITRRDWTPSSTGAGFVFPDNPHVLLGLNELVEKIVDDAGYMIREFHAVCDIPDGQWYDDGPDNEWPLNSAGRGQGGWWGGITKNQLREHYEFVQLKIDRNDIVVLNPTEAVRYRMTANASSNPVLSRDGGRYKLNVSTTNIDEKYWEEITVFVHLNESTDELHVEYANKNNAFGEASPRIQTRKFDGNIWAVSVNPFFGEAILTPGKAFDVVKPDFDGDNTSIVDGSTSTTNAKAAFVGIQQNSIALDLPAGNYNVNLYNVQGRLVGSATTNSINGVVNTGLSTANLTNGMYILQVSQSGASVLNQRIMIQ